MDIGQLKQGGIQDADVVRGGVAAGIPASQRGRQELAGVVAEGQHRVIAEGLLERRRGLLLLAMTDHDRSIEVDHQTRQDPACSLGRREHFAGELGPLGPHHLTCRRPRRRDRVQVNAIELIQQPPAGRVRGNRTEQFRLISQHRDVRDHRRAISDRDRHVN